MTSLFVVPEAANSVKLTQELIRIIRIPRRSWDGFEDVLSDLLKRPGGTMSLRPVQARSLYDMGLAGGFFGPLRVGAGKTLVSLLAPIVLFSTRPVLLVPAKLVDKTRRDQAVLARHWDLPNFLRIISYEWLGRAQAAEALTAYRPDLIISDECHKLKNRSAAVTRRVRRFFNAYPETKCVAMSGTITKRSLFDFAHILEWCLPADSVPLPHNHNDLEMWADALDERKGQTRRADPGMLEYLCNDEEKILWQTDRRRAARQAFRRRMTDTTGVVATEETPIDATLTVRSIEPPQSNDVDEAFDTLRSTWTTPDGWPISDGLAMFRHARELALGFYYVWDPRPPKYWLNARSEWCAYVRGILKHSRTLDSELQVRNAHPDAPELAAWIAVREDFIPNTEPRWVDDSVVESCAQWLHKNDGIVWTEHTCFAERLSAISGITYYGRKGQDKTGRAIETHPPGQPLIASIQSNAEGRNLQAWHKNLITSPPANGQQWEQLLGRTHRDGQTADEVSFDVLTSCAEHVGAVWQAVKDSQFVLDTTGSPQKLLLADLEVPTAGDVMRRTGARWDKSLPA